MNLSFIHRSLLWNQWFRFFFPDDKRTLSPSNLWCRMKFYGKNSMNEFSLKWYLRFNIKCFNPWANHNLTRVRRLARPQDTIRQRHQPIIWKYLWSGGRLLLDAELPSDIKFSFTRWFIKATTHRWIKMFTRRGYKTCELVPFCYWLQMLCC